MDANFTTLLGGGAIIATVTLLWDKIKFVCSRLVSFLVVTVEIDRGLAFILSGYMAKNLKEFKYQPLSFGSDNIFIRPLKRIGRVVYRNFSGIKTIYFKSGIPIFVSGMLDDGASMPSDNKQKDSISFIRGTLDIRKLIIDATDYENKLRTSFNGDKTRNRFDIKYFYGNNLVSDDRTGQPKGEYAMPATDIQNMASIYSLMLKTNEILKWKYEELGEFDNTGQIKYLAFPPEVDDFLTEIKHWIESEEWYKEKKIPWKRGWLLFGQPGCGKSALVSAMAQLYDLPIYSFDLPSMSNRDFKHYWCEARSRAPCIVLIEDIDNVFRGRDNITKSDRRDSLTFDCFLNTISGVQNSDGILLCVTSNNVEYLDEALGVPRKDKHVNGTFISTRPGRIDRVLELKIMDEECRKRLAGRILVECPEFIEKAVKDGEGDTGAQFQERCSQIALREYWKKK